MFRVASVALLFSAAIFSFDAAAQAAKCVLADGRVDLKDKLCIGPGKTLQFSNAPTKREAEQRDQAARASQEDWQRRAWALEQREAQRAAAEREARVQQQAPAPQTVGPYGSPPNAAYVVGDAHMSSTLLLREQEQREHELRIERARAAAARRTTTCFTPQGSDYSYCR